VAKLFDLRAEFATAWKARYSPVYVIYLRNYLLTPWQEAPVLKIVLLTAKCCINRQVNKRQAPASAVELLFTVRNVVLKKTVQGICQARCNRSLATPALGNYIIIY